MSNDDERQAPEGIIEKLQELGLHILEETFFEAFKNVPLQDRNNPSKLLDAALNLDFKKVGKAFLPKDIHTSKEFELAGPAVLQVAGVVDISQPSTKQHRTERSTLIVRLTDGHTTVAGVEVTPLPQLSVGTAPGTKVRVPAGGCAGRHGKLLLGLPPPRGGAAGAAAAGAAAAAAAGGLELLGGRVPRLFERWREAQELSSRARGAAAVVAAAPPSTPAAAAAAAGGAAEAPPPRFSPFSEERVQAQKKEKEIQRKQQRVSVKEDAKELTDTKGRDLPVPAEVAAAAAAAAAAARARRGPRGSLRPHGAAAEAARANRHLAAAAAAAVARPSSPTPPTPSPTGPVVHFCISDGESVGRPRERSMTAPPHTLPGEEGNGHEDLEVLESFAAMTIDGPRCVLCTITEVNVKRLPGLTPQKRYLVFHLQDSDGAKIQAPVQTEMAGYLLGIQDVDSLLQLDDSELREYVQGMVVTLNSHFKGLQATFDIQFFGNVPFVTNILAQASEDSKGDIVSSSNLVQESGERDQYHSSNKENKVINQESNKRHTNKKKSKGSRYTKVVKEQPKEPEKIFRQEVGEPVPTNASITNAQSKQNSTTTRSKTRQADPRGKGDLGKEKRPTQPLYNPKGKRDSENPSSHAAQNAEMAESSAKHKSTISSDGGKNNHAGHQPCRQTGTERKIRPKKKTTQTASGDPTRGLSASAPSFTPGTVPVGPEPPSTAPPPPSLPSTATTGPRSNRRYQRGESGGRSGQGGGRGRGKGRGRGGRPGARPTADDSHGRGI